MNGFSNSKFNGNDSCLYNQLTFRDKFSGLELCQICQAQRATTEQDL
jgi:hypothetical protein